MIVLLLLAMAGAPLDRGDFRTARALGDVKPGLVSLVLDADAVARSRDLADVRIVDAHDDQVPYIVDALTTPVVVPLKIPRRTRDGSSSVYHFALPYIGKLELTTSARVFERNVSLQRQRQFWEGTDPDRPRRRSSSIAGRLTSTSSSTMATTRRCRSPRPGSFSPATRFAPPRPAVRSRCCTARRSRRRTTTSR